MLQYKNLYFLLLLLILVSGCEDVIDMKLPEAEPRLVIQGYYNYNDDGLFNSYVRLSLTSSFFEEETTPVLGAEVNLIDLTHNYVYKLTDDENDGYYSSISFFPEFDVDYKLQVTYNNELYESTPEQLIHSVPIDNLTLGDGVLFEGNEKEVIVTFTDDGSRDDFYLFKFAVNSYFASEDRFYQGNTFSFSYFYAEDDVGNEATISIYGITERYYNYMSILIDQAENGGNSFAGTPVNARGNINNLTKPDNYPYGYFRLSEFYSKTIELK